MIAMERVHKPLIVAAFRLYIKYYQSEVAGPLSDMLMVLPDEVRDYQSRLQTEFQKAANSSIYTDRCMHSVVMRVLLWRRRTLAAQLEVPRGLTTDSNVIKELDSRVFDIDSILQYYAACTPASEPSFKDYMAISNIAKASGSDWSEPPPVFDDKFGILLAPSQVELNFHYYREQCELRGVPLVFMFVDIDDFKPLNTEHGHAKVDADLLPQFQQALDSHVYCRGRAYRQGGDEYIFFFLTRTMTKPDGLRVASSKSWNLFATASLWTPTQQCL